MTNSKSNPKKRDRKATEEAILIAASHLFSEKGFENTRTLEIARKAGANEALIARYFGGKEGLLIALMKKRANLDSLKNEECVMLETFPSAHEVKDLKEGILKFFKNGKKSLEMKEQFARIGCARAMVDPEMAEVIRSHIIEQHVPEVAGKLKTYFDARRRTKLDLEAMAMLIVSVNFNMNFMGRKIYRLDDRRIDRALKTLAYSLDCFVDQDH